YPGLVGAGRAGGEGSGGGVAADGEVPVALVDGEVLAVGPGGVGVAPQDDDDAVPGRPVGGHRVHGVGEQRHVVPVAGHVVSAPGADAGPGAGGAEPVVDVVGPQVVAEADGVAGAGVVGDAGPGGHVQHVARGDRDDHAQQGGVGARLVADEDP